MMAMRVDESGCKAVSFSVDDLFVFERRKLANRQDFLILNADGGGVGSFATAVDEKDVSDEGAGSGAAEEGQQEAAGEPKKDGSKFHSQAGLKSKLRKNLKRVGQSDDFQ